MREHFLLDPEFAFLNHGSFGACPIPVFEAFQAWQAKLEQQPVAFFQRALGEHMNTARSVAAEYLNADTDHLHFVRNATVGVNIIARSVNLQPGDEVLTTNHEYGAVDAIWEFVCEQAGAHYVKRSIPLPYTSDVDFIEQLWQGVSERTRVIALSHITSPTALTLPVERVCKRAREEGITTAVDGAHAPGQLPLNLTTINADYYTGNFHKWLCAPKSAGFLYTQPEHTETLYPLVLSWGWARGEVGTTRHEWKGTDNPAAYLSVPDAIKWQVEQKWDAVREACHTLAVDYRARLVELCGTRPTSPDDNFRQMFTVELPPCDAANVQETLWRDYKVEVPVTIWNGRQFLRVSVQGYNTAADLDRLLHAVGDVFR
ncbi:MAG: aminotransferase class V-fold PLP-dependent enzyme [Chloroflexota bacterium]